MLWTFEQCCALNLYLNSFKFCNKSLGHLLLHHLPSSLAPSFIQLHMNRFWSTSIQRWWSRTVADSSAMTFYHLQCYIPEPLECFICYEISGEVSVLAVREEVIENAERNSSKMIVWSNCSNVHMWLGCVSVASKFSWNCIQFGVCDANAIEHCFRQPKFFRFTSYFDRWKTHKTLLFATSQHFTVHKSPDAKRIKTGNEPNFHGNQYSCWWVRKFSKLSCWHFQSAPWKTVWYKSYWAKARTSINKSRESCIPSFAIMFAGS